MLYWCICHIVAEVSLQRQHVQCPESSWANVIFFLIFNKCHSSATQVVDSVPKKVSRPQYCSWELLHIETWIKLASKLLEWATIYHRDFEMHLTLECHRCVTTSVVSFKHSRSPHDENMHKIIFLTRISSSAAVCTSTIKRLPTASFVMPDQTNLKCVLKDVTSNLINVGCRNTIATALINLPS